MSIMSGIFCIKYAKNCRYVYDIGDGKTTTTQKPNQHMNAYLSENMCIKYYAIIRCVALVISVGVKRPSLQMLCQDLSRIFREGKASQKYAETEEMIMIMAMANHTVIDINENDIKEPSCHPRGYLCHLYWLLHPSGISNGHPI
jgi:hypothetical protein